MCYWLLVVGEQGLMIGSIPPLNNKFYKGSKEMNEKKIIRNVFNANDAFFNFGDMMYLDKDYYMYFRDRVGDTFRYAILIEYQYRIQSFMSSITMCN